MTAIPSAIQPADAWETAGTTRRARICQPAVKLDPDPICFHGDEQRKTISCRILPEGLPFSTGHSDEIVWSLSGTATTFPGKPAVNVRRGHVGRELVCTWTPSLTGETNAPPMRTVKRTIYECAICECEEDDHWCETHNCVHRFCACDSLDLVEETLETAWCGLHERCVSECLGTEDTNTVSVCEFSEGDGTDGPYTGSGEVFEKREDGRCSYYGFFDSTPIPLNDDDDNANLTVDNVDLVADDRNVTWDDDLRYFLPLACGGCPCRTHPHALTFLDNLNAAPWGLNIHQAVRVNPEKTGGYYAEGIEKSLYLGDMKVVTPLEDLQTGRRYSVTNAFTVLGLRLVPDLFRDNEAEGNEPIDKYDWALMGELAKCGGLGFCVTPGQRHPILFQNDVLLVGDFDISFDGVSGGELRLYESKDAVKPFLVSRENAKWWKVDGEEKYASKVYWIEASTNGVSGVLRYRFRGTDENTGHGCVAGLTCRARFVAMKDSPSINLFKAVKPDLFYITGNTIEVRKDGSEEIVSAKSQHYTMDYDATTHTNKAYKLIVNGLDNKLAASGGDLLNLIKGENVPDVVGHYPNAAAGDHPYLEGQMKTVRTVNFFNRNDYALNIWLMNNATKPDNLDGVLARDTSFGYKKQTVQVTEGAETVEKTQYSFHRHTADGDVLIPFPGSYPSKTGSSEDEYARARSCVFSFLVPTRSLAVGQLDMGEHVMWHIDLGEKEYGFKESHYYHSKQFRSNVADEYKVWQLIKDEIDLRTWK